MKTCLFLLFIILIAFSSFSQNPCNDSLYNELKKKDLNTISEREYEYFILKEKLCTEHLGKNYEKVSLTSGVKNYIRKKKNAGIPLLIFGYCCLAATIPLTIVGATANEEVFFADIPVGAVGATCTILGHVFIAKASIAKNTGEISLNRKQTFIFSIAFNL